MDTPPPYRRFWLLLGLSLLLLVLAPGPPAQRDQPPRAPTAPSTRATPQPGPTYHAALHLDRAVLWLQAE